MAIRASSPDHAYLQGLLREGAARARVEPPAVVTERHVARALASWRGVDQLPEGASAPYDPVPPVERRDELVGGLQRIRERMPSLAGRRVLLAALAALAIGTLGAAAVVPAVHDPFASAVSGLADTLFGDDEPEGAAVTTPVAGPQATSGVKRGKVGNLGSLYGRSKGGGAATSGTSPSGTSSSSAGGSSAGSSGASSVASGSYATGTGSSSSGSGSSSSGGGSCPPGLVAKQNGSGGVSCVAPGSGNGNNQDFHYGAGD